MECSAFVISEAFSVDLHSVARCSYCSYIYDCFLAAASTVAASTQHRLRMYVREHFTAKLGRPCILIHRDVALAGVVPYLPIFTVVISTLYACVLGISCMYAVCQRGAVITSIVPNCLCGGDVGGGDRGPHPNIVHVALIDQRCENGWNLACMLFIYLQHGDSTVP